MPLDFLPEREVAVASAKSAPLSATAIGVFLSPAATGIPHSGIGHAALIAAGFRGELGSTMTVPVEGGPALIATGVGVARLLTPSRLREAAAAFAQAARGHTHLGLSTSLLPALDAADAQALVEGTVLASYRFKKLGGTASIPALDSVTLIDERAHSGIGAGLERGRVFALAQCLARDLANTPHNYLTASKLADFAASVGAKKGFTVEIFGPEQLQELGCGGLLGVNAGSSEPPRMIKLSYRPARPQGSSVALVGKGIMYDSGGISLKPSDPIHARMKNDMSGAAAVLAAVVALCELRSDIAVTGYLMCTDNMPSGTAMALGDVLTIRGGTTVEIIDTDAEGRLVLADALVLASEDRHDAIIDIATLTGSCMRALGPDLAGLVTNDALLGRQVEKAAEATGELVWQLPLHRQYMSMLDSDVADLKNCAPVGKPDAILASLFLERFVGGKPWAHLDICGPADNESDRSWHSRGCSGYGARLLAEIVRNYQKSPQ